MEKLLISACLLGEPCRYDGKSKPLHHLHKLKTRYDLVAVCPEVLGGLKTPRPPCERIGDKVMTKEGKDFTFAYQKGAEKVLAIAKKEGCQRALLKEKSPSCGVNYRYDGTFTKRVVKGSGLTTDLLKKEGLKVFSETSLHHFEEAL